MLERDIILSARLVAFWGLRVKKKMMMMRSKKQSGSEALESLGWERSEVSKRVLAVGMILLLSTFTLFFLKKKN